MKDTLLYLVESAWSGIVNSIPYVLAIFLAIFEWMTKNKIKTALLIISPIIMVLLGVDWAYGIIFAGLLIFLNHIFSSGMYS